MKYKLINDRNGNPYMVFREEDNSSIPFAQQNSDYQQYLAWLAEGNQPEPAEEQ